MLRRILCVLVMMTFATTLLGVAGAELIDNWDLTHGIDCVGDSFNPIQPDGTRNPAGDPAPDSAAWTERDRQRRECARQRDFDRAYHPSHVNDWSVASYGSDWYRVPDQHDNVRFRFDHFNTLDISGVPSAEVYRPCSNAPGDCPNLPAGLQRFDPPYPVVVVMHGVIAQDAHHRYNTQVFAENGYMAIGVDGYGAGYAWPAYGPNSQRCENPAGVINWLASPGSGIFGQEADLSRVAVAGHSQGSSCALEYQSDPRPQVDAILAWDGGDSISANNCVAPNFRCTPIMYQRTDGEFSLPQTYAVSRANYTSGRDRGLTTYNSHKARGMDVMHIALRATSHIDWNGNGVGLLAGNRLSESVIDYYSLAWLDRHLKGKLVLTGNEPPAEETAERAYRQALAENAYQRLIAGKFPAGSIDKHNISMGFWDPDKAIESLDPLYGGNVPYGIEGLWTTDRLSTDFRSYCSVSVPNYTLTGSGAPAVIARADSGAASGSGHANDMRIHGCPEVFRY